MTCVHTFITISRSFSEIQSSKSASQINTQDNDLGDSDEDGASSAIDNDSITIFPVLHQANMIQYRRSNGGNSTEQSIRSSHKWLDTYAILPTGAGLEWEFSKSRHIVDWIRSLPNTIHETMIYTLRDMPLHGTLNRATASRSDPIRAAVSK
jgi:hypothetical protein